jgi:hypothetical protein
MSPTPWPKPKVRVKVPKVLQRGKPLTTQGGALFPKVRNREYRAYIRGMDCLLTNRSTQDEMTCYDVTTARGFVHVCWGPIDPAHVGDHQAQGAPDVGCVIPLCRAAHRYYDEHRQSFYRVTGISERQLVSIAAGLALKWAERGR